MIGLFAVLRREKSGGLLATLAALVGFLLTTTLVVYRDGIRDLTLLTAGFDVWSQKVVPNWPIVSLFLGVFVIGLLFLGWLVLIAVKAKPNTEEVHP